MMARRNFAAPPATLPPHFPKFFPTIREFPEHHFAAFVVGACRIRGLHPQGGE
jgi:hypothetical protein